MMRSLPPTNARIVGQLVLTRGQSTSHTLIAVSLDARTRRETASWLLHAHVENPRKSPCSRKMKRQLQERNLASFRFERETGAGASALELDDGDARCPLFAPDELMTRPTERLIGFHASGVSAKL